MTAAPAPSPADQVAQIVTDLCELVDHGRMRKHPALAGIFGYIFMALSLIRIRLVRLADRLRAGPLAPPRPRASSRLATAPPLKRRQEPPRLPRKFGKLSEMLGCDGPPYAERLRALLADPQVVASIVATPQLGRYLRPLCRVLGVPLIPELRLPKRARKRAPAKPPSASPPPSPPAPPAPPPMMDFVPTAQQRYWPIGQHVRVVRRDHGPNARLIVIRSPPT